MRTAITIATLHAGGFRVLATPDKSVNQQRREFKEFLRGGRAHPEFSAVEIYTSGGSGSIRKRLAHPDRVSQIAAANVPPAPDEAEGFDPATPPAPPVDAPSPEPVAPKSSSKRGGK